MSGYPWLPLMGRFEPQQPTLASSNGSGTVWSPHMAELTTGRDLLVLWRWREALEVQGTVVTGAWGAHARGLNRGDRMFVWATKDNELYLLGAIEVKRSGDDWNEGRSLYGPFQIIPFRESLTLSDSSQRIVSNFRGKHRSHCRFGQDEVPHERPLDSLRRLLRGA